MDYLESITCDRMRKKSYSKNKNIIFTTLVWYKTSFKAIKHNFMVFATLKLTAPLCEELIAKPL